MIRSVIAVFAVLLVAGVARADDRPTLAVFDLESHGADPLQAQAASQAVVRGLRDLDAFQVLSAEDVRQMLAIERGRQLVGVSVNQDASALGKTLGAKNVVVGSITRVGSGLTLDLRLLDTQAAKVVSHRSLGPVADMAKVATALPGLAQELVGPLLAAEQGELLVRAREESAEVLVDGNLLGSTPLAAVKLPRGQHRLEVRKDGFISQSVPVRIEHDQVRVQDVVLVPSPDFAEAWKERHGRLRLGAYIATGVAVAALSGGILLDRLSTQPKYDNEFSPRQQWLKAQAGTGSQAMPAEIASNPAAAAIWTGCGSAPADCAQQATDLQGQIKLQQGITVGLLGLGVVAAGTATYLWLTGKDPNRYSGLVAGVASDGKTSGFALSGSF